MKYVRGCHCNVCPSCTHRLKLCKGAAKRRAKEYTEARLAAAWLTKKIKQLEATA